MNNKSVLKWIVAISLLLVAAVAFLYVVEPLGKIDKADIVFLPLLHAILNSLTALCLIAGAIAIKQKANKKLHASFMISAFVLSSLFLISYVVYHSLAPSTPYGGEGVMRYIYFVLLISHILLAIIVVPFVLLAFYFALSKQFTRHRKIVKWTLPIWLYVAISGVLVYVMISPYY